MARTLEVQIIGDTKNLEKAYQSAGSATSGLGSKFGGLAKMAVLGAGAAGIGALVVGLKSSVDAAKEAEVSQAAMEAALRTVGVAYKEHQAVIDTTIQKTSKLAGVDDEELQGAFTKLVRSSGNVGKSLEGMNLAADIAAARHISLEAATKMVEKAMNGNENAFKRVGLEMGKNATAAEALDAAQKRFGGSAEAFGNTAAGAQAKLGVAFENLQETIGQKLLPVLASAAQGLVDLIAWSEANWPRFREAIEPVIHAVKVAIEAMIAGAVASWPTLKTVLAAVVTAFKAAKDAAVVVADHMEGPMKTAIEVAKTAFNVLKTAISVTQDTIEFLMPVIKLLASFLVGAFHAAVTAAKVVLAIWKAEFDLVKGAITLVIDVGRTLVGWISGAFTASVNAGKAVVSAFETAVSAVETAFDATKAAGSTLIGWLKSAWGVAWQGAMIYLWPIRTALGAIDDVLSAIASAARSAADAIRAIPIPHLPNFHIPGLAAGGPVAAGRAYVVGENGPELFLPGASGQIIPNGATSTLTRAGGGVTLNFYGHVWDRDNLIADVRAGLLQAKNSGVSLGFN